MSGRTKADTLDAPEDVGRIFKVIKGQVGPWNFVNDNGKPDVFTEQEFRRLNPIPDTDQARKQLDPDSYHSDLLGRLLSLGVITHAPDDTPTPTPLGPLGTPGQPVKNATIAAAVQEALSAKSQTAALKASDVAQTGARAEPKDAPKSGTSAVPK